MGVIEAGSMSSNNNFCSMFMRTPNGPDVVEQQFLLDVYANPKNGPDVVEQHFLFDVYANPQNGPYVVEQQFLLDVYANPRNARMSSNNNFYSTTSPIQVH